MHTCMHACMRGSCMRGSKTHMHMKVQLSPCDRKVFSKKKLSVSERCHCEREHHMRLQYLLVKNVLLIEFFFVQSLFLYSETCL